MLMNLVKVMDEHGISTSELAILLGISSNDVQSKIAEFDDFTLSELAMIQVLFFPDFSIDYLSDSSIILIETRFPLT